MLSKNERIFSLFFSFLYLLSGQVFNMCKIKKKVPLFPLG